MLEPNGEDVPRAGAELNRDVDAPKPCDGEELAPNGDGDEPKIEGAGAGADVEDPKADELKEGADEVPNAEGKVEVFGANGLELEGVVVEKGLADD